MMTNKDDFNDNNVLSYVYQKKEHKSYEMDKKKEANIQKIMMNFPAHDKLEQYSRTRAGDINGPNPTSGPTKQE